MKRVAITQSDVGARYDSHANPPGLTLETDVPSKSSGKSSGRMTSNTGSKTSSARKATTAARLAMAQHRGTSARLLLAAELHHASGHDGLGGDDDMVIAKTRVGCLQ